MNEMYEHVEMKPKVQSQKIGVGMLLHEAVPSRFSGTLASEKG